MTGPGEHWLIIGAVATSVTAMLLGLGATFGSFSLLSFVMLCGGTSSVMWMTHRVYETLRLRAIVPTPLLNRRSHGSLDAITDSEGRCLRPIGETALEVAARTDVLLTELLATPGVRIFRGARPVGTGLPPVPHTISAGRRLVLVESVVWPSGRYQLAANGRIHCDGVYIGQSVHALITSVRAWREILPSSHQVSAVVVVHRGAGERMTLPVATRKDLAWFFPQDVVRGIRWLGLDGRRAVKRNTIAALVAGIVPGHCGRSAGR